MSSPSLFSRKFLPVYDIGDVPESVFVPFNFVGLTEASITWSGLDEILTKEVTIDNSEAQLQDDIPIFVANEDTLLFLHEGDDTAFDRTFIVKPNMSLDIIKCFLSLCFVLNMSARTNGDRTLDKIRVTITKRKGTQTSDQGSVIMDTVFDTGLAACDAANEARAFILQEQFDGAMIEIGDQLEFRFRPNVAGSGTNTFQIGLVPLFAFQTTNAVKTYSVSGLNSHMVPRMDSKRVILTENLHVD